MLTKNEQVIVRAARYAKTIEIRIVDGQQSGFLSFEQDGQFNKEIADAIYGYFNRKHFNRV